MNAVVRKNVARDQMRAALRSLGATHYGHADATTDWFTLKNPDRFFEARDRLPFQTLYCNEREGGLVVYWDKPNFPATIAVAYAVVDAIDETGRLRGDGTALRKLAEEAIEAYGAGT